MIAARNVHGHPTALVRSRRTSAVAWTKPAAPASAPAGSPTVMEPSPRPPHWSCSSARRPTGKRCRRRFASRRAGGSSPSGRDGRADPDSRAPGEHPVVMPAPATALMSSWCGLAAGTSENRSLAHATEAASAAPSTSAATSAIVEGAGFLPALIVASSFSTNVTPHRFRARAARRASRRAARGVEGRATRLAGATRGRLLDDRRAALDRATALDPGGVAQHVAGRERGPGHTGARVVVRRTIS